MDLLTVVFMSCIYFIFNLFPGEKRDLKDSKHCIIIKMIYKNPRHVFNHFTNSTQFSIT